MEPATTKSTQNPLNFKFTYQELGVFLLLFFLNLKFAFITIIQNRSVLVDLTVYLLLILTFNYSNWTLKSLTRATVVFGIYTLINFSSYKLNVLMPLLIVQSISAIRFKKYLIINMWITAGTLIIMYIINGEGINMAGFSFIIDRKERMTFGFGHPNSAALYYYCFMINGLLLVYFSKFRARVPLYLLLIFPLWVYVYKLTASRSFLLSIVVLYGSYFYYYLGQKIDKGNRFRLINSIFIGMVLLFSATTLYFSFESDNFSVLNRILSKRLTFYSVFLDQITPLDFFFGSDAYKNLVIDSSYIHLLFEGGIFFFLGFSLFYVFSTVKMVNKKDWVPICVVISFMAYGLMETVLLFNMLIGTNILWVTLYYYYKDGKMRL